MVTARTLASRRAYPSGDERRWPPHVLRLAGLPSPARHPRVSVTRGPETIELVFSGPDGSRRVDAPLDLVGSDDPEHAELELLGQLQLLGFSVTRRLAGE